MDWKRACAGLAALIAACVAPHSAVAGTDLPWRVVADVPLPGNTTRFDYASDDPARHRLFLAHLGQNEVLAFDTRTRKTIGVVGNIRQVHGVLAIPELGRVYASATGTNEVVAIDETRLTEVARIPVGIHPDGMAYAPGVGRLYVSDEMGRTETVIDVRTNRRIATIPLGGEVGNSQYDRASGHIFVNVQTRGHLVEIDPATDRVIRRIRLRGADDNHGLLIEPRSRRAFIACAGNDRLLVLDLRTRRITQTLPIGHDPDVLAFDPRTNLLYVASESGTVSLMALQAGRLRMLGAGRLAPDAHVVAVDPDTDLAYFPIRNLGGRPMLRITEVVGRGVR